ncbi:MAG: hypothetical protein OEM63_07750 [Gammaproteobacteria bacterium]|nr:hypothetical protein [Gammaproteobacteria bacterium]
MQRLTTILLATGVCATSNAHELPGMEGLLHETLSLHHLPALLLVAAGAAILLRAIRRSRQDSNRNMHP